MNKASVKAESYRVRRENKKSVKVENKRVIEIKE